jgi:hypothetical protein
MVDEENKSFSYADVITGEVEVSYLWWKKADKENLLLLFLWICITIIMSYETLEGALKYATNISYRA